LREEALRLRLENEPLRRHRTLFWHDPATRLQMVDLKGTAAAEVTAARCFSYEGAFIDVRYAPDSDQIPHRTDVTRCATSGPLLAHSITLSALATSAGGMESPSCLAVLRLMDNSNLVTW
jgi:hypothetical protein